MLTHRSTAAGPSQLAWKPAARAGVRVHAVEAPAKLSATDRVKLGDSDLEVSGEVHAWLPATQAASDLTSPEAAKNAIQRTQHTSTQLVWSVEAGRHHVYLPASHYFR
jgi:hypothetical protein